MSSTNPKSKRIVFYSWQSDLPNATNRGFIEDALTKAAASIATDTSIEVEPVIERDVKGVSGSPDISKTILEKIDRAAVFVADVSIINMGSEARPTPNPNVLIELGYALKTLGWGRVILVMNKEFGGPELLPFDLKIRLAITYSSKKDDTDRAPEKKLLGKILEEQIRLILMEPARENFEQTPDAQLIGMIEKKDPAKSRAARNYMEFLNNALEQIYPGVYTGADYDETLVQSLEATKELLVGFAKVIEAVATFDDDTSLNELFQGFKRLLEHYHLPLGYNGRYSSADQDFYKFIGDELFTTLIAVLMKEGKWTLIKTVLEARVVINNFGGRKTESVGFEYFSCFNLESFRVRDQRLRRVSCRADILKERHSKSPIGDVVPEADYIAADYFLLLKSQSNPEDTWLGWMAWSSLYMKDEPQFLIAAQSKKILQKIIGALDISNLDDFKEVIKKASSHLVKMWGSLWGRSIDPEIIQKIGIYP